ncbi:MAG: hypothetical protein L0H83_10090 [Salinisphaera sp.]|nr:hypothetical protein [Salinisphaera sp.]
MTTTTQPMCIFHGNCADGFSAAWAVWLRHPDWSFHGASHGKDPPDVAGRDVYLVDFSYKRPVIEQMLRAARSITILDHHQSARDELADMLPSKGFAGIIDMDRSGCRLAWHWFHTATPPPPLLLHVEDRDLWRFALAGTAEIQEALFSYPYDFRTWSTLMLRYPIDALVREGKAIRRKKMKAVHEFIQVACRRMTICGFDVPALNAPYFYSSEAGHIMAGGEPFAACYWDTADGRVFSLRSSEAGEDVAKIAERYGGGGHARASGFRAAIGWEGEP